MDVVDPDFGHYPRRRVATYRAYRIDDAGLIAETATVFEAPDDDTAIARARALMGNSDRSEIWEGARQVGVATLVPEDVDLAAHRPVQDTI